MLVSAVREDKYFLSLKNKIFLSKSRFIVYFVNVTSVPSVVPAPSLSSMSGERLQLRLLDVSHNLIMAIDDEALSGQFTFSLLFMKMLLLYCKS